MKLQAQWRIVGPSDLHDEDQELIFSSKQRCETYNYHRHGEVNQLGSQPVPASPRETESSKDSFEGCRVQQTDSASTVMSGGPSRSQITGIHHSSRLSDSHDRLSEWFQSNVAGGIVQKLEQHNLFRHLWEGKRDWKQVNK